ncbi:MAG: WD40 repeat domain-containing protein [Candidatus Heimdallarchaeota archaeon]
MKLEKIVLRLKTAATLISPFFLLLLSCSGIMFVLDSVNVGEHHDTQTDPDFSDRYLPPSPKTPGRDGFGELTEERLPLGRLSPRATNEATGIKSSQDEPPEIQPNPLSGAVVRTFSGHIGSVESVAFSPDGSILASGSGDYSIKLWDVGRGTLLRTLRKHNGEVSSVTFSPNGKSLASGSWDNNIVIWDVAKRKAVRTLRGHTLDVYTVAFNPSGELLASGDHNGTVKLWDVASGKLLWTKFAHSSRIGSVVFAPNGSYLASGGWDSFVNLWNVSTSELLQSYSRPLSEVRDLAFSPDGTVLGIATGIPLENRGEIRFWNLTSGEEPQLFDWATRAFSTLAFSPDGAKLATGLAHGAIGLWYLDGREWIWGKDESGTNEVTFSPDGTLLAVGTDDNLARLRNVVAVQQVENLYGHTGAVQSVAFAPDGSLLASSGWDETIRLWNTTDGTGWQTLSGYNDSVHSVAFSPDGSLLASGQGDSTIQLWNVTNGTILRELSGGHRWGITSVAFSPSGATLASSGWDWNIRFWNVTTGAPIRVLFETSSVLSIAYHPSDERILVSGSEDGSIAFWDIPNRYNYELLQDHSGEVFSVAFSHDGRHLASGGEDRMIRLWNVTYNYSQSALPAVTPWKTLIGHGDSVRSVDWSWDGTLLASGSNDRTVRLWNVTSGAELQTFPAHTANVVSVAFSPNGSQMASGGADRLVRLWDLDPLPLDSDLDGMADYWERKYGLDHSNFWDKFDDPDDDALMNSLEFFLGINPINADTDNDGMPDGWEYQMGLALLHDDAGADSDSDGMPNHWEYDFGFDATDPADAGRDSDRDGVSNVNEYRGGSNPRNFWSVPLLSLSLPHIGVGALLLVIGNVAFAVWQYRDRRRRTVITRLGAPDYATALKIQKSGFADHESFLQADLEAKALIEKALSSYQHQNYAVAFRQLELSLTLYERLENRLLVAETIYHLVRLQKEMELLTADNSILQRFPQPPYDDPTIEGLDHMLQALVAESEKNWGLAESAWHTALDTPGLSIGFLTRCQGALVEAEIRKWLSNPSAPIQDKLRSRLDSWQEACETNQQFESLCQVYLLRAKVALASFQFEEMEQWLAQCLTTAETADLQHYQEIARNEVAKSAEHKERLSALIDKERLLVPEEKEKILHEYIRKAVLIIED